MISRRRFMQAAGAVAASPFLPRMSLAGTGDFLELTARPGTAPLLGEGSPEVPIWGYDGAVPGPIIRGRKGGTIRVRFRNELDQPTSIHWHGIRIENSMDGVAGLTQPAVEPGDTFDYVFAVPDAGTYWYHAHNRSWEQVERGLYGALIVDEAEPVFAPAQDVTLVLDDCRLSPSGRIDEGFGDMGDWSHGGRLGNWLTINGATRPDIPLAAGRTSRVRLINAANARILELDLESLGATVVAYDGQPLAAPEAPAYNPFLLGPGQRMDLLVTPEAPGTLALIEMSGEPFAFGQFVVTPADDQEAEAPAALLPNLLPEPDLANAVEFDLDMAGGMMGRMTGAIVDGRYLEGEELFASRQVWAFNGVAGLSPEPFFGVERGTSVILNVTNDTAFPHAMHVHGHHFRIVARSDSEIDHRPWRDTFLIGPTQTTRIAFVADNPGKWLFHCHMLEHQAAGMKTWFEVT